MRTEPARRTAASERVGEPLKQVALFGIVRSLIFGVPLDRQNEPPRGEFDGFDSSVFRVAGADPEPAGKPRHRLVVPRIHLPRLPAGDTRQQAAGLDRHAVGRQASVGCAPDMAPGGGQVLYQASPQVHIQDLHPAANPKQGQVASQCFIDEGGFDSVPLRIGRFGFRRCDFAVERRVDIATAGQQESAAGADPQAGPGLLENRLRARRMQSRRAYGWTSARSRYTTRTLAFMEARLLLNCTCGADLCDGAARQHGDDRLRSVVSSLARENRPL